MSGGGCWTPGPWTKSRAGMTAQAGGGAPSDGGRTRTPRGPSGRMGAGSSVLGMGSWGPGQGPRAPFSSPKGALLWTQHPQQRPQVSAFSRKQSQV